MPSIAQFFKGLAAKDENQHKRFLQATEFRTPKISSLLFAEVFVTPLSFHFSYLSLALPFATSNQEQQGDDGRIYSLGPLVAAVVGSLYAKKAGSENRYGDPICDAIAIQRFFNRTIVSIADGCSWGTQSRNASHCALSRFTDNVLNYHESCYSLKQMSYLLLNSLVKAHNAIQGKSETLPVTSPIEGSTTLLGGMIFPVCSTKKEALELQENERIMSSSLLRDVKKELEKSRKNLKLRISGSDHSPSLNSSARQPIVEKETVSSRSQLRSSLPSVLFSDAKSNKLMASFSASFKYDTQKTKERRSISSKLSPDKSDVLGNDCDSSSSRRKRRHNSTDSAPNAESNEKSWCFTFCSIGDCKAYLISRDSAKRIISVTELTSFYRKRKAINSSSSDSSEESPTNNANKKKETIDDDKNTEIEMISEKEYTGSESISPPIISQSYPTENFPLDSAIVSSKPQQLSSIKTEFSDVSNFSSLFRKFDSNYSLYTFVDDSGQSIDSVDQNGLPPRVFSLSPISALRFESPTLPIMETKQQQIEGKDGTQSSCNAVRSNSCYDRELLSFASNTLTSNSFSDFDSEMQHQLSICKQNTKKHNKCTTRDYLSSSLDPVCNFSSKSLAGAKQGIVSPTIWKVRDFNTSTHSLKATQSFGTNRTVSESPKLTKQNSNSCQFPSSKKTLDVTDCGGRIGSELDTRNLSLEYAFCEENDLILCISDGVHDNFELEVLGLPPSYFGANINNWDEIDDEEIDAFKSNCSQQLLLKIIQFSRTPQEVCERVKQHCLESTRACREYMETNNGKKVPKNHSKYPGKMDHYSILCVEVGYSDPIHDAPAVPTQYNTLRRPSNSLVSSLPLTSNKRENTTSSRNPQFDAVDPAIFELVLKNRLSKEQKDIEKEYTKGRDDKLKDKKALFKKSPRGTSASCSNISELNGSRRNSVSPINEKIKVSNSFTRKPELSTPQKSDEPFQTDSLLSDPSKKALPTTHNETQEFQTSPLPPTLLNILNEPLNNTTTILRPSSHRKRSIRRRSTASAQPRHKVRSKRPLFLKTSNLCTNVPKHSVKYNSFTAFKNPFETSRRRKSL